MCNTAQGLCKRMPIFHTFSLTLRVLIREEIIIISQMMIVLVRRSMNRVSGKTR